jgi:hypothetical protein
VPRPAPRRRPSRRLLIGLGCGAAAALAAGGTLWAQAAGEPSQRAAQVQPTPRQTGADWLGALATLDEQRARAFAVRDPALLRRVYSAGPLLAADTALLRRIVPAGCGLTGARTRYDGVRVSAHGDQLTLTATATLAPSRLICHGTQRGVAAGAGPTRLRLQLIRTSDGYRIAAERPIN